MAKKTCWRCGEPVSDEQSVCPVCGAALNELRIKSKKMNSSNSSDGLKDYKQNYGYSNNGQKSSHGFTWTGLAAVLSLIGFIVNVVFFFMSLSSSYREISVLLYIVILFGHALTVAVLFELTGIVKKYK